MSEAEFDRFDRRGQNSTNRVIPEVRPETLVLVEREFKDFPGTRAELISSYLDRIQKQNLRVAEFMRHYYKLETEESSRNAVTLAAIRVYRILELVFEQCGEKMPTVEREVVTAAKQDLVRAIQSGQDFFLEVAKTLRYENYFLLAALCVDVVEIASQHDFNVQGLRSMHCALGVYSLIAVQAEINKLRSLEGLE